jgi:signal peptidase I
MTSILVALSGLVAPGFAHGLMRQRRAMWIAIGATFASAVLIAITIWALWLPAAVMLGTLVHAGLTHRRLGGRIRWSALDALLAFGASIAAAILLRMFVIEAFKIPSSSMYPTVQIGDHLFVNKLWGSPAPGDLIVFRQPCEPDRDYISRVIAEGGDTIEIRCSVVYVNGKPIPRDLVDGETFYEDLDISSDGEGKWYRKSCSRYRETIGDHTFDIFHDSELPKREADRTGGAAEVRADSKDFPHDRQPRSCSYQPDGESRERTNQQPGRIVVVSTDPQPCTPYMHFVVPESSLFVMGDNRDNSNDSRYWGTVPISNVKGRVKGIWLPLGRLGSIQ